MMEGLTVGRIVHYRETTGGPCMAAIVTRVETEGRIGVVMLADHADMPSAQYREAELPQPELLDRKRGTWHWPERV